MNILVCTDGSAVAERAVQKAAEAAQLLKESEITVLHVHQPIQTAPPYGHAPHHFEGRLSQLKVPEELEDGLRQQARMVLEEAEKVLEQAGVSYRLELIDGHPVAKIIDYVEEHDIDLLMIGNKGRSGLQKTLLGSVSSGVIQEADCDIVLVK